MLTVFQMKWSFSQHTLFSNALTWSFSVFCFPKHDHWVPILLTKNKKKTASRLCSSQTNINFISWFSFMIQICDAWDWNILCWNSWRKLLLNLFIASQKWHTNYFHWEIRGKIDLWRNLWEGFILFFKRCTSKNCWWPKMREKLHVCFLSNFSNSYHLELKTTFLTYFSKKISKMKAIIGYFVLGAHAFLLAVTNNRLDLTLPKEHKMFVQNHFFKH